MSECISTHIPVISTAMVAIATVVLVWLTSRYVRLTGRMVEEMRKSREPVVICDFELPDGSLRFVVRNAGQTLAKNIRITIRQDIDCIRGRKGMTGVAGLPPIERGISYLAPGRTLKYYLGVPDLQGIENKEVLVSLQIEFENERGTEFISGFDFDINQFSGVLFGSFRDPSLEIADSIRNADSSRKLDESAKQLSERLSRQLSRESPCPYCCELVNENAKKCKHCGEWISEDETQEENG